MSTLEEIRSGLSRFWDSVAEGWHQLASRASGALTRFKPSEKKDKAGLLVPSHKGIGWGLLAAELYDDGDRVMVRLEAPGMERKDFDVSVVDGMLLIYGEKRYQEQRKQGGYHISECAYGVFERAIPLPDNVDGRRAKAKYSRGVLHIELPKTTSGRHQLDIETD